MGNKQDEVEPAEVYHGLGSRNEGSCSLIAAHDRNLDITNVFFKEINTTKWIFV